MKHLADLLVELSPPEFYTWGILCGLCSRTERKIKITSDQVKAFYSNCQFRRILKSLEAKKYLIIMETPKNQSGSLVVYLRPHGRLSIFDQAPDHFRATEAENHVKNGPLEHFCSGDFEGENPETARASGPGLSKFAQAATQLSLSLKEKEIKAWVKMDQGELLRRLKVMAYGDQEELLNKLGRGAPIARGKRSLQAKIYAAIRFLQEQASVKKPQSYVEAVAKKAEHQLKGDSWRDASSGNGGKLQSRRASGES